MILYEVVPCCVKSNCLAEVGNFINHGVGEVVEGAIRGISVDSLSSLASFKTGAAGS